MMQIKLKEITVREKPKGKKEQDQEMRMPAKEFDRIMGEQLFLPHEGRGNEVR